MIITFLLSTALAATPLPDNKRKCAEQIIAIFENGQLELKYDYIEDLKDGRGFTAGRSGFCTGTGDLVQVVREYTSKVPKNPLAKYLPKLDELAKKWSPETKELPDFEKAWTEASKDQKFREAQDAVTNKLYLNPALQLADKYGLKKTFSKVALYEAIIQHGEGTEDATKEDCENHDGLNAMLKRASKKVGGTAKDKVSEDKFMEAFLQERKAVLSHACAEPTRNEWKKSVGRADAMIKIFQTQNHELNDPVTLNPFGTSFTLKNCGTGKVEGKAAKK